VQETADRLKQEAQGKQELLKKEFEGERNVLTARIEALQQTVKEQTARTAGLSAQLEKSYGQVQEIAVRAIEGSSKAIVYSQPVVSESSRRTSQSDG
jgi:uncharacterized membrane-anchored protein YhcB (DUF1043 family)